MTSAPPPLNFAAIADAWDNPAAYAAAINTYYAQLRQQGYAIPGPDITAPVTEGEA